MTMPAPPLVRFLAAVAVLGAAAAAAALAAGPEAGTAAAGVEPLPANRWVRVEPAGGRAPSFRSHGGAAYDARRDRIVFFGSDTHGVEDDNGVYAFDLATRTWQVLRPPTPAYAQRVDARGRRVGGVAAPAPWAMHVYGNVAYDPRLDGLLVTSSPQHNHRPAPGAERDPVWLFDLARLRWRMVSPDRAAAALVDAPGPAAPLFFGTGTLHDPARDAIVAYNALTVPTLWLPIGAEGAVARYGVWELDPARAGWRLATPESRPGIAASLALDAHRHAMHVFGPHDEPGRHWRYLLPDGPGGAGRWEPAGDGAGGCPPGWNAPVAYDAGNRVFVRLAPAAGRMLTCLYDPRAGREWAIPAGALPATGLNHQMVFDPGRGVVLLATGNPWGNVRTEIRALRLDPQRPAGPGEP